MWTSRTPVHIFCNFCSSQKGGGQLLWAPRGARVYHYKFTGIYQGLIEPTGNPWPSFAAVHWLWLRRRLDGKGPAPAPLNKSAHALTEQQTYLQCTHTYTDHSCRSGYRTRNVTHTKQRVAPSLCDLSLITPVSESPCPIPSLLFLKNKKKA